MKGAFLKQMATGSHQRMRAAKRTLSEATLAERARASPQPPPLRLATRGFDLIAELKLRSPAAGQLGARDTNIAQRVCAYAGAGAAAVSVLTEPARFDGSLSHLSEAVQALTPLAVPAMRKDFLVDPYQVLEARVAGAGGVLIILRMLSRAETDALMACARAYGMFVLLEAFDAQDLELMHEFIDARERPDVLLVGVNCRDLITLEVVPERLAELAPLLPKHLPRVAESGVVTAADAREVAAAGYGVALVGSALMRGSDPAPLVQALLAAGRAVRGGAS